MLLFLRTSLGDCLPYRHEAVCLSLSCTERETERGQETGRDRHAPLILQFEAFSFKWPITEAQTEREGKRTKSSGGWGGEQTERQMELQNTKRAVNRRNPEVCMSCSNPAGPQPRPPNSEAGAQVHFRFRVNTTQQEVPRWEHKLYTMCTLYIMS